MAMLSFESCTAPLDRLAGANSQAARARTEAVGEQAQSTRSAEIAPQKSRLGVEYY